MPSVRIVVEDKPAAHPSDAAISHLGGLPSLAASVFWPRWDRTRYLEAQIAHLEERLGRNPQSAGLRRRVARSRDELTRPVIPLAFLGQLELGEVWPVAQFADWPSEGTLAFFYARPDDAWGYDPVVRGHCRVLYCPRMGKTAVMPAPDDLPDEAKSPERAVRLASEWTLPTSIDMDGVRLSFWVRGDYRDLCRRITSNLDDESPIHRCGGHPQQVQGEMRLECQLVTNGIYCGDSSGYSDPRAATLAQGAADWQLLLQIDSDRQLGWMWGDAGRLYFWARQQDIAQTQL